MRIDDQNRAAKYQKDAAAEQRLQRINRLLAPVNADLVAPFTEPELPVLFIVGAPGSGTTLLAQALAVSGGLAYINNFVARFWQAPALAAQIDLALGLQRQSRPVDFQSTFGVTEHWSGPHEFGYFWERWFTFDQTHKVGAEPLARIDGAALQRELAALESVYAKPLFFKNLTCGLQIEFLATTLPTAVFVLCRRQPVYNAQSLLLARRERMGDDRLWFSLRPQEYPRLCRLPPCDQVAGQVHYTLREIERALRTLPAERHVAVAYEDLTADPRAAMAKLSASLPLARTAGPWQVTQLPAAFPSANTRRVEVAEFQQLQDAWRRLSAAAPEPGAES